MLTLKRVTVVTLICFAFTFAGCSDSKSGTVEGTVTLDGSPLASGTISFVPADGQSTSAVAVIENGKYKTEIDPGVKKVKINGALASSTPLSYGPGAPKKNVGSKDPVPLKYNSATTLEETIEAGENTKDFTLQSK